MADALVRLVVLNYEGGTHVLRCLDHLAALDWPRDQLEVVVIDNASTDGSADAAAGHPVVSRLVRLEKNIGFPANNLALRDLDGVHCVGLVNNDAFVEPGYLPPLVSELDRDPTVGAVVPLVLFAPRFVDVTIEVPAAAPGRGDSRPLGVLVRGLRVDGEDRWAQARFAEGSHGPELASDGTVEWTGPRAVVRVPVPDEGAVPAEVELLLSAIEAKTARLTSGDDSVEERVSRTPTWVTVPLGGEPYDVVNNAGNVIYDDGHGADRGFGSADLGAFADPCDVVAWSGGAVLLRPEYLADVGLFDERFFLYYEDTDLAWRGAARGWRYRYVPEARVRHIHAATTLAGSAPFEYFTTRNRLVMLLKDAPATLALGAVSQEVASLWRALRGDVLRPLVRARRPNLRPAWRRVLALAGFARLVPGLLRDRPLVRRRQTVSDDRMMAMLIRR
jgi:GT2 family glycosyltransferase